MAGLSGRVKKTAGEFSLKKPSILWTKLQSWRVVSAIPVKIIRGLIYIFFLKKI